jgi:hypothetical protein
MVAEDVRLSGKEKPVLALLAEWGPRHGLLGVLGTIVITVLVALLAASRTQDHPQ